MEMKEKIHRINIDALIKTEEKNIGFNGSAFLDDKLSRGFLWNHIGEMSLAGEFINYGHKGSALFKNCILKENWTTILFDLGHMWWQNVYPINPNLVEGRYLVAYGRVYEYNNKYGFEVIKFL